MKDRIVSFVMSGGVGSRLWPLSREDNPKQFHDFSGDGSMLAKTIRRLQSRDWAPTPVHLIASERHAERLHDDLESFGMSGSAAIFEPVGRNTAAAVAIATLQTMAEHGDALVLVVPSDHEISTEKQFWQTRREGHSGGRGRARRGVWHQAGPPGNRLRLYRGQGRRRCARCLALRGKA